jgi:DNA-binding MarR family transcriptional regulator
MTSTETARAAASASGPDSCHCLAARRSGRYLTRFYDQHLAPSGLSISQFSLLALVDAHPDVSISALADLMVMERTTLMRALKPLRADELLVCEPQGPKAALALRLTQAGQEKLALAGPYWQAAQQAFEAQVGSSKADKLRQDTLDVVFSR